MLIHQFEVLLPARYANLVRNIGKNRLAWRSPSTEPGIAFSSVTPRGRSIARCLLTSYSCQTCASRAACGSAGAGILLPLSVGAAGRTCLNCFIFGIFRHIGIAPSCSPTRGINLESMQGLVAHGPLRKGFKVRVRVGVGVGVRLRLKRS